MSITHNFDIGQEIESTCSKCKDVTVHVIEKIKDEKPAKVMCKSCLSSHRYRSPELVPAAKTASKTVSKSTKSAVPKVKKVAAATKTPEQRKWSRLCNKVDTENPKDYHMQDSFIQHDVIQHQKFGLGVVVEILNKTKITVAFQEGVKTLVHNRI